jgi:hypothetical protein
MQPQGMIAIIATRMSQSAILIHIARLHRQAAAAIALAQQQPQLRASLLTRPSAEK